MAKIKQPDFERLMRYKVMVMILKDNFVVLVNEHASGVDILPIDEACVVGKLHAIGYMTIPDFKLRGNTYFTHVIATKEMLDFLNVNP